MKTASVCILAALAFSAPSAKAFVTTSPKQTYGTSLSATRSDSLRQIGFASAFLLSSAAARAEDDESELIKVLKARSEANKAADKVESFRSDKLSSKDFSAQYNKPSLQFVNVKSTGEVQVMDTKQVNEMIDAGKVVVEYGMSTKRDGTEFEDFSKKSYVLVESQDSSSQ